MKNTGYDIRCCETMIKAQQYGTAHDMCVSAVSFEGYKIGHALTPIKFCPWCGVKIYD